MRMPLRTVPALLIALSAAVMPRPASAGFSCAYYRWDGQSWRRVVVLQDDESYESTHYRGVDWNCKYCVPLQVISPPSVSEMLAQVQAMSAPLIEAAATTVGQLRDGVPVPVPVEVNALGGPACPPVPPEWDALD